MKLPTDSETEKWYSDNINSECSASSAIYKFRIRLSELESSEEHESPLAEG